MSGDELRPFGRVANVYDETRAMPPEVVATIADAIVGRLRNAAAAPRLLEVGVGTGRIAVPLAERGVRVAGIDIAPEMLARLREKAGSGAGVAIDLAFAEASRPPFREGVFDGALFVHILHLVPDATATVRSAIGCIRAGGWLLLGGDDRSPGHRDEADAVVAEAIRDVTGSLEAAGQRHGRGIAAFEQESAAAGMQAESEVVARWESQTSGRQLLDRLAARTFSASWVIPDEQLPAVVAAAESGLRKLYGDLDRTVPFARTFTLRSARKPE